MNIAEKIELENNLKTNLANWMIQHGNVLEYRVGNNQYTELTWVQVVWRKQTYNIIDIGGVVCRIEKVDSGLAE